MLKLLANSFIIYTKKRSLLIIKDETDKPPKINAHLEEKDYLITQNGLKKAMYNDKS